MDHLCFLILTDDDGNPMKATWEEAQKESQAKAEAWGLPRDNGGLAVANTTKKQVGTTYINKVENFIVGVTDTTKKQVGTLETLTR